MKKYFFLIIITFSFFVSEKTVGASLSGSFRQNLSVKVYSAHLAPQNNQNQLPVFFEDFLFFEDIDTEDDADQKTKFILAGASLFQQGNSLCGNQKESPNTDLRLHSKPPAPIYKLNRVFRL